jgi:uncharacterized membrane protein
MIRPKKSKPVDVCLYGAVAGLLCGSAYASYARFNSAALTIEWVAFVGVTAVAGAILSGACSELLNCIARRQ